MPEMASSTNKNLSVASTKILVVGSLTPPDAGDWLKKTLSELADGVFSSIHRGGAEYIFVDASAANSSPEELLRQAGGLLVLGGGDADPACYGQVPIVETMYAINPKADQFELDLIRQGSTNNLPILGICRGMQLINIAFGGELIQDIGSGLHSGTVDNSVMVSHPVTLTVGSRLQSIYLNCEVMIRSGHHQAISRVGEGLTVTARAADGVVEAIEANEKNWIVGVQWHPEDPMASQDDLDLLMGAFLNAARQNDRLQLKTAKSKSCIA
ncbi:MULTISPECIES: gamma-glutamyl-gamma-aminobutyrate hydrolase family protein [unclassified Pseudomonas]|uniref:gamma-glutamyl-gamma-aminobutyrate hydrolase family protein n=1 Tax=unclassified Pseudomonas TaxID=196821 RepID=UPI000CD2AC8B|nr:MULTISPECIES: gamma-glutamyl-gamma-aminobutyrate hydrolase family protein [unclassified Pseudomonas]POA28216.1 hypothetical protein C1887_24965 [Pseudomonas sp. GW456-R21]POA62130.1 hypothetical protein C1884_27660 [Pseudomonas sp. GW460-R15]